MDRGKDIPTNRAVTVTAPAHLHLGMFSFGRNDVPAYHVPAFGGVGWMIDQPATRVQVRSADQLTCIGPDSNRIQQAVTSLGAAGLIPNSIPCQIEVLETPQPHVGLGTGTQLALAVGRAVLTWLGRDDVSTERLARALGRARRSAVGTYGFDRGGFIIEAGRTTNDATSPLLDRVPLPAAWRFILFIPTADPGLSGEAEQQAFDRLPPVPLETTAELQRLALAEMAPAAREADFDRFSEAAYQFGHLAGSCFAAVQGGPYRSAATAKLVQSLRDRGIRGVGQSSWGPTVFALFSSAAQAESFTAAAATDPSFANMSLLIAPPNNAGASIQQL